MKINVFQCHLIPQGSQLATCTSSSRPNEKAHTQRETKHTENWAGSLIASKYKINTKCKHIYFQHCLSLIAMSVYTETHEKHNPQTHDWRLHKLREEKDTPIEKEI